MVGGLVAPTALRREHDIGAREALHRKRAGIGVNADTDPSVIGSNIVDAIEPAPEKAGCDLPSSGILTRLRGFAP